ncbi:MAG: MFS transporter, partial [Alphaproteobacteria bacterium HGW-Alphaproteobacteria-13]
MTAGLKADGTATPHSIPTDRMAVLFAVMLVSAAGSTALQSILPAMGTKLNIPDVWVSLAFSWSALLWVLTAPHWARQSDKRGRKALMAMGTIGFFVSMALCGLVLWAGLEGLIGAGLTFILFALFRSLFGGFGSAAPPAVQAYIAART